MHTLAGFFASITNGAVLAAVAGVPDQALTADSNNRIKVPGPWKLLAGYAAGANLTRAQVNAPSFRNPFLPELYPSATALTVPSPANPFIMGDAGPRFQSGDYFVPQVSRGGAGASNVAVLAWIGPAFAPAPSGPTYTLVGTVTPTYTAGTWVLANPVWDQTLPVGNWHVVGGASVAANGLATRLVFPGGAQYRPGWLNSTAYGDVVNGNPFRFGAMGHYGTFAYDAPPQIEVLGHTAGASATTVFLDLIKA